MTNKCSDSDLSYYVRECGEILGVTSQLPTNHRSAKHVLEFVLTQLAEFRKLNQVRLLKKIIEKKDNFFKKIKINFTGDS